MSQAIVIEVEAHSAAIRALNVPGQGPGREGFGRGVRNAFWRIVFGGMIRL